MAEKIGLAAELDLSKWNRAVTSYLSSVSKMQAANTALAGSAGLAFRSMQGNIVSSLGHSIGAIQGFTFHLGQLKSALGSTFNTGQATRQLNILNTAINRTISNMGRLSSAKANVNIGGGGFGNILGGIGGVLGGISGGVAGAVGGITSGIGAIFGIVGGLGKAFTSVVGIIARSVSTIIGLVAGLASGIARVIGGVINIVVGLGRAFFSVVGTIGNAIGAIIRVVSGLVSGIARTISSVINIVVGLGRAFFSIVGTIASAVTSVLRTVGSLVSGIVGAFTSMLRSVLSVVGNLASGIVNAFTSLVGSVLNVIGKLASSIANAFSSIISSVLSVIGSLARSIVGVFSSLLRSITTVVGNIASSVFNIFSSLAKSVVGIVAGMASAVLNTVMNMANKIKDTLFAIAGSILSSYRDLGTQLLRIVTVATAAVVGATVLAGRKMGDWLKDAITLAADFEQNLADIASVLRATTAEVGPLADKIDKLALDPKLVVSTQQASDVVEQLARNGLTMTQILEGAAEASILLANATGGEFRNAADIATMAMQMFNLEASEMTRVADVSQGVVNNSRIDLEDWSLALGNGGAAAATANVSLEEFATGIAATVNLYHTARQAGTGMTNFIQRLVPLTDVAADEMKKLGLFTGLTDEAFADLSTEIQATEQRIADLDPRLVHYDELVAAHTKHLEELKNQMVVGTNSFFFNEEEAAMARANGQLDARAGGFKGLAEASELLKNATKDLTEEELIEVNRRIFGNDALETAIGMARMGKDAFNKLKSEIAINGSAAEASAVRTATLTKRWENLGDIWDAIQRKSGAGFNKMLLNLVNRLTELTNKNQDRVILFFGRMAELINKIVDAALPWVERQLPMLIDNLEALASWLVEVALGGGKAKEWFGKMNPTLRNFIERVIGVARGVKQFAKDVIAFGQTLWVAMRPFINFIKENVELKDVLIAAAGAIAFSIVPGFLKMIAIAGFAVKAVSAIRHAWETDWMGIRSFFENLWPKIKGPLVDFINNLLTGRWRDAWVSVVSVVGTALRDLEAVVPPFFKTFVNLLSDLLRGDWKGVWRNFVAIATDSFNLIKVGLTALNTPFTRFILNVLEGDWGDVWKSISTVAITAFALVKRGLTALDTPFTDFIVDILEGDWESVWKKIGNVAVFAFEAVKKGLKSLDNPFTNFIVKILEGDWEGVWNDIAKIAKIAFNKILDFLDAMETPFTDFLFNVLTGAWDKAWAYIQAKAMLAYNNIVAGLYTMDIPISNFLGNILTGKWNLVWADIKKGATLAYGWVVDELYKINTPVSNFLGNVLTGKWDLVWQDIKLGASIAYGWVVEQLYAIDTPVSNFLGNVLTGRWNLVWETVKTAATTAYNWIVDQLYAIGNPITTFLAGVLSGEWGDAWEFIKAKAYDTYNKIIDALYGFGNQFTTFTADILSGNWAAVWKTMQNKAIEALENIKQYTPPWGDEFISSIQSILEGDWAEAWTHAQTGATLALDEIKKYLPPWGQEFVGTLQAILNGEWAVAWGHAKAGAILGLEEIKKLLPPWGDEFVTALQLILDGKWSAAWGHARDGAVLGLEEIKDFLPPWGDRLVSALQMILQGRWTAAWSEAQLGLTGPEGMFPTIGREVEKLDTPISRFIGSVLQGKWNVAWTEAKAMLFDPVYGLFPKLLAWANTESKPVIAWFQINMPTATAAAETGFKDVKTAWDRFVEAATKSETKTNLDTLAGIVITGISKALEVLLLAGTAIIQFFNGDWKTGWETAGDAVKIFGELPVLAAITTWFGTTFPLAAQAFLDKMPEIEAAWEPVATKWPQTWVTIKTWWDSTAMPFLDSVLASITGHFGQMLIDIGVLFSAIETLLTGEGSLSDRLAAAGEIVRQNLAGDVGMFEDFFDSLPPIFKSKAATAGKSVTAGFNEGIKVGTIVGDDGNPIPEGLVYWSSGIQGAMTQVQQTIYDSAKVLGEQTNYGYVAGLGDPNSPIVSGLTEWTQKIEDAANAALEIDSPSKKSWRMGKFFQQGFRDGILDNMSLSLDAAGKMASKVAGTLDNFKTGLQETIGPVTGNISANIQHQISQMTTPKMSTSASYSTYNSPVTINNYIYNQMDQAQLEYMMQNTLNKAGLA